MFYIITLSIFFSLTPVSAKNALAFHDTLAFLVILILSFS